MKMKVGKLIEIKEAVTKLLNNDDMPFNLSYRLSDAVPGIDAELRKTESLNNELVKKYGVKNPQTGMISVDRTSDKFPEFLKEREAILDEETEIDIQSIPAASLASTKVTISAVNMAYLKEVGIIV